MNLNSVKSLLLVELKAIPRLTTVFLVMTMVLSISFVLGIGYSMEADDHLSKTQLFELVRVILTYSAIASSLFLAPIAILNRSFFVKKK